MRKIAAVMATFGLGAVGVLATTGTAQATQEGFGYTCDTVVYTAGVATGLGNCVAEGGAPSVGSINQQYQVSGRSDPSLVYFCQPAVSAGVLRPAGVAAVPVSVVGLLICLQQVGP